MFRLLVVTWFAALLPAAPTTGPAPAGPGPTCRGSLEGGSFTTTFVQPDGYRVEGQWEVRFVEAPRDGRPNTVATSAALERLREYADGSTKDPTRVKLAEPWRLDIVDRAPVAALNRVVELWCEAVLMATTIAGRETVASLRPDRIT